MPTTRPAPASAKAAPRTAAKPARRKRATAAASPPTGRADIPRIGQPWPGRGGIYAGILRGAEGKPDQHVIVSPAKPRGALNWAAAGTWAAKVGTDKHDDFTLPSRDESALLYANLRTEFVGGWHWTSTEYSDGSCAWGQYFFNGAQDDFLKSYEGRARAVRRFDVQSFDSSQEAA